MRDDSHVHPHSLEALRVPRGSDRVVAGVASGWADRWRVEPTVVRAAVGLLTLAGGLGAVLYGLAAVVSTGPVGGPSPPPRPAECRPLAARAVHRLRDRRRARRLPGHRPVAGRRDHAARCGDRRGDLRGVVDGRHHAHPRRAAPCVPCRSSPGRCCSSPASSSLASRTGGLGNLGASASAIAVVVGGLAIFGAPALGRLLRRLDDERAARIREDERAIVAAHLHDSVLQSLVLMQRTSDPRRMTTIARRQERELRAWLYGTTREGEPTSLHAAIDAVAVDIEADHDIRIEAVVVGDQPLDDASRALVAAVREAVVNAARHADVDRVDVFVEADDAELTGFVRDTGRGFVPATIGDDRRGISESIVGRIQRVGGIAVLTSSPGNGTEVELRVPRRRA